MGIVWILKFSMKLVKKLIKKYQRVAQNLQSGLSGVAKEGYSTSGTRRNSCDLDFRWDMTTCRGEISM
jgi:hypothetical protein